MLHLSIINPITHSIDKWSKYSREEKQNDVKPLIFDRNQVSRIGTELHPSWGSVLEVIIKPFSDIDALPRI